MTPEPIILIGRPASAITRASEELLDGFIVAMQAFDTETLLAIADERDEIHADGWMQRCIREYVEVWALTDFVTPDGGPRFALR